MNKVDECANVRTESYNMKATELDLHFQMTMDIEIKTESSEGLNLQKIWKVSQWQKLQCLRGKELLEKISQVK